LNRAAPTVSIFLVSVVILAGGRACGDEWAGVRTQDGVQVQARSVAGCKAKEFRATGRIDAPPERVLAILTDVESYKGWMPMTEQTRLLKREGASAWYYMVIDAPMVSRRDYCIRMSVSRLPDGKLQTAWTEAEDICPKPGKGLVRIETNHGFWQLAATDGGRATEAVYQGLSTADGSVPGWIANLASARELPNLFQALRRAVASQRRPPAPVIAETEPR
jgi:uncharacterized protein YndB with AHSA1/START domain